MPKLITPLTAKQISEIETPGLHAIGHIPGLVLKITNKFQRYYVLRYRFKKQTKYVTVGNAEIITFPTARKIALGYARMVAENIDPALSKRELKQPEKKKKESKKAVINPLFRVADEYLVFREESGAFKHAQKGKKDFEAMMSRYVYPIIQTEDVSEITEHQILEVLKPIWIEKPSMSCKLKGHLKGIFDYAILKRYRTASNPVDMNGSLGVVLRTLKSKRKDFSHRPALSWKDIPDFISALYNRHTVSSYALMFSILTATRSKAVRLMKWDEIDNMKHEWNIPIEHDKIKKINANRTIFLSTAAQQLLKRVKHKDEYVFVTQNLNPMNDSTFGKVIRDLNATRERFGEKIFVDENIIDPETNKPSVITQHGTARASFRSWASDDANEDKRFNIDAVEMCLLQERKDPLKGAYDRCDHLTERRRIMEEWGKWCTSKISQTFWQS